MSYIEPDITSSYRNHSQAGKTLYDLVMDLKPKKIVEFGVLNGYSSICMGQALRDLDQGHIFAYDNWSENSYDTAMKNISHFRLTDRISLGAKEFYSWLGSEDDFDLLHVDVNNTGHTIKLLAEHFSGKHVIFEGGIPDRDRVPWMYDRYPIAGSAPYEVLYDKFPGLSKLK